MAQRLEWTVKGVYSILPLLIGTEGAKADWCQGSCSFRSGLSDGLLIRRCRELPDCSYRPQRKNILTEFRLIRYNNATCRCDGMADVTDSKSVGVKPVWVRVSPPALRMGCRLTERLVCSFFIRLCGKCSRHLHTNLMIRGWSSAETVRSPYHEMCITFEHGWLRADPLFGSTFFDRGEMPFSFDSVYCWWMVTLWFGIDGSRIIRL